VCVVVACPGDFLVTLSFLPLNQNQKELKNKRRVEPE
jgi:hypothetical protein